ncbi:MAG: peptidoglycan-binding protein [Candidatus Sericytochromatia bacterium]|nr:peptidoglycan-binding protein [Candidatus Sericytochromatia bacterium]
MQIPSSRPPAESPAPLTPSIVRQAAQQPPATAPSPAALPQDQAEFDPRLQQAASAQATQNLVDPEQGLSFEPAPELDDIRQGRTEMKTGQRGEPVASFQSLLMQIGVLVAGAPSRSYTPVIEAAVKDYQARRNLTPTGHLNQQTLREAENEAASRDIQAEANQRPRP